MQKTILQPIAETSILAPYFKMCAHCRMVYKAVHTTSAHCLLCATCGEYKSFTDMAGKAASVGYVCQSCYGSKPYVKQFRYTILLRF